jgi:SAM-dependent methyltransferase
VTRGWASQRRYYRRAGIDAWRRGTVPHHVTSNAALAAAYADIVRGFVRDTRHRGPLTILELGAGSGHFAFLFLRACAERRLRIRYVMTDIVTSTIAFWRRHAALAPFFRSGALAVARFDAERDRRVPVAPVDRLVVIASYVFSSLRHEAAGTSLVPAGALSSLDRLSALVREDMLVLVADRVADRPLGRTLGVARYGAASFPVDARALGSWATRRGGATVFRPRTHRHIHVSGLVTTSRAWRATRAAGARAVGASGPDAVYAERRRLEHTSPTLRRLLALIDRAGPDPRAIAECVRPLWPHLAGARARTHRRLRDAVVAAWANYYHLGEETDLAFILGLLLYEIRAYEASRRLFEESLRLYGEDAATQWNLGLCHLALGHAVEARAAFRRSRALAPGLTSAGPALTKATT